MTPDYRAICAELVAAVDLLCGSGYSPRQPVSRLILTVHVEALEELAARARALLAEADGPAVPDGREPASVALQPSDGEVAELVEWLRRICFDVAPCDADAITRAADLLEAQP